MEQTKFLGCLGNINLFEVNDRLIEILQTEKIIKKDNRDYGIEITDESKSITLLTHYKGNSYELSSELIDEIYGLLKNYVMRVSDSYHDFNDISFNSNAFLDKASKIDYYKTQYQKVFPKDPQQFSIYRGQGKNGLQEWRDYCELWIADSTTLLNHYLNYKNHTEKEQFEIPIELRFVQYIKGHETEFIALNDDFFDFLKLWIQFQETDEILEKITHEINDLSNSNTSELSALEIAYYAYYQSESKTKFLNNVFPSEAGHKELGDKFNRDWNNIKISYNDISNNRDTRLKNNSRKKKIEKILPYLSEAGQELAREEINTIY